MEVRFDLPIVWRVCLVEMGIYIIQLINGDATSQSMIVKGSFYLKYSG